MPVLAPGLPASTPSTNETVTAAAVVDVEDLVVDDRPSGTLLVVDRFTTVVVGGILPGLRVGEGVAALFFLTIVSLFAVVAFAVVTFAVVVFGLVTFTVTLLTASIRNVCGGPTGARLSTVPNAERVSIARKTTTTVMATAIAINCWEHRRCNMVKP